MAVLPSSRHCTADARFCIKEVGIRANMTRVTTLKIAALCGSLAATAHLSF